MSFNIAIDGPAGAGKSTIAKTLAKELSFIYVDTGAMYRALAYYFINNNFNGDNEDEISSNVGKATVEIVYEDGQQKVILNGQDVSAYIRNEAVGNMASTTSQYKAVRAHLLELQKSLARNNDVIMDGRDIGTCVLPNANVKIYLTASVETRANRRYKELLEKGEKADLDKISRDIEERDYRDMHREIAPLKQADDAILVDSSDMTIEDVVNTILDIVRKAK